jgi:hypothetical protein
MSRLKWKKHCLTRSLIKRDIEANPEKGSSGGFLGQKEVGALFPKERSVIAIYAEVWRSVGDLLTLGQGYQGLKLQKMSKNSKNSNSNSIIMLSMIG